MPGGVLEEHVAKSQTTDKKIINSTRKTMKVSRQWTTVWGNELLQHNTVRPCLKRRTLFGNQSLLSEKIGEVRPCMRSSSCAKLNKVQGWLCSGSLHLHWSVKVSYNLTWDSEFCFILTSAQHGPAIKCALTCRGLFVDVAKQ
jgi:hypothetical protein